MFLQTASSYKGLREPTTIVLLEGYLTDRSDDRVGHLNSSLAREGGNLNDPIFTSSNTRAFSTLGGGGGC